MALRHFAPGRLRLLLVGTDPVCKAAAISAAAALGAEIDLLDSVDDALRWMMRADRVCSHLLACCPLDAAQIDALAGMVDEVTSRPTPLLLLGTDMTMGPNVISVTHTGTNGIVTAVRAHSHAVPQATPVLSRNALRAALHAGWVRMRFQPILATETLAPVGLEALARLHHPDFGILHPRDFLPQAIEQGQERGFAGIAAARVFLDLRSLAAPAALDGLVFAFNVPVTTFCAVYAFERAQHLCSVAGIDPARVVVEVVETPTLPDMAALAAAVRRWRAAGFGVAIDDAGPGLPHWRQMLDLDFSMLKLDGRLGGDPARGAFAAEITAAAQARGLCVVAEGVEDEAALARMRALGVDRVQGFLFSRPLPALAVPLWLEAWRGRAMR